MSDETKERPEKMVMKIKQCAECQTPLRDKVAVFIPGLTGGACNLCADCMDKHLENHLSEERRSGRNAPSFRGLVSFTKHHTTAKRPARARTPVTKETITDALRSGKLSVEDLLDAVKEI